MWNVFGKSVSLTNNNNEGRLCILCTTTFLHYYFIRLQLCSCKERGQCSPKPKQIDNQGDFHLYPLFPFPIQFVCLFQLHSELLDAEAMHHAHFLGCSSLKRKKQAGKQVGLQRDKLIRMYRCGDINKPFFMMQVSLLMLKSYFIV